MLFNADYFLRGVETGVSNYTDYRWLPTVTIPMAQTVIRVLGLHNGQTVLDFGASRGYLVRALRMLGVDAYGYDISEWAVSNCDAQVVEYLHSKMPDRCFDWIWSKDTLEHIPTEDLLLTVQKLFTLATKGVFIIVPLANNTGGVYLCPNDEKDKTHLQRLTMVDWLQLLQSMAPPNWIISGSYKVPVLKASSELFPRSTAFITCKPI